MIIGITGHRPDRCGGWTVPNEKSIKIKEELSKIFKEKDAQIVITGMALGSDMYASEVAIDMNIGLWAAVPCDDQDLLWNKEQREKYKNLINACSNVINVSPGYYQPYKMMKRNEWIVDNCDEMVAVWDGKNSGGTYKTIEYAKKENKNCRIIKV